jgi:2-phosphosulfolactate phosphatase
VAGERRGEPLAGFDLGNSPLEFTAERVAGRMIFFTTSNGTEALLAARPAAEVAVAAFVNLAAVAAWAAAAARNVVIACAGDAGQRSLEDEVCAGLLVDRLRTIRPDAILGPEAEDAAARATVYGKDLARLARDSPWARRLSNHGRSRDLTACLTLDAFTLVPVYRANIDKIVSPYG